MHILKSHKSHFLKMSSWSGDAAPNEMWQDNETLINGSVTAA